MQVGRWLNVQYMYLQEGMRPRSIDQVLDGMLGWLGTIEGKQNLVHLNVSIKLRIISPFRHFAIFASRYQARYGRI